MLILLRFFSRPSNAVPNLQVAKVMSGDLKVDLALVGSLDAARTHMVSSALKGDRGKIIYLVEDGTTVAKDDVLVRLDPTPFETEIHRLRGEVRGLEAAVESATHMVAWEKNQTERQIQSARYDMKVAKLELKRLVEGDGPLQLSQYKSDLDAAKEEYERYLAYEADLKKLKGQGFTNFNELTMARKKIKELKEKYQTARQRHDSYQKHVLPALVETARAKVERTAADIEQMKKGAGLKIAREAATLTEVQGKLETTRSGLKEAITELKKTVIRAPFGGITILYETFRDGQKRKPRVGDLVWQNQPLLYLPDISSMVVKSQVREVDLHKVEVGQFCSVRVDAYPQTLFKGKVTNIGILATERFESGLGEKYFQLMVTLTDENSRLRPGMTARINVDGKTATAILYVPVQAVFDNGAETFCYRLEKENLYRRKAVEIGRQNEDVVEIVEGLAAGETVSLLRPPIEKVIRSYQ
ncbi:MAG: efflux RND transporter periplasmic adaptor subunit [Desulfobacteraceae bacterium]|jgi:HlyD family secretion protein